MQADWGYVPSIEGWEAARFAAQAALQLDSNSALAHAVLGIMHTKYDWDWLAAESEFKAAMTFAPTNPLVLQNAAIERIAVGKWSEGTSLLDAAIRADPLDAVSYLCRGWVYMQLSRLAEAEHAFERVLEISPSYAWGHYYLGISLLVQNKNEQALVEMLKEPDGEARSAGLAVAYYALHRAKDSDAALRRLEGTDGSVDAWWLGAARAHAFRGQKDQALQELEKAYSERSGDLYLIKSDPFMKSLDGDARYKTFLRKMNLPG
jgi:tetratricopeptide (TPR) repeat protein